MRFSLKDKFGEKIQEWLLNAVTVGRLDQVKEIVTHSCFNPEDVDEAIWQAGYFGQDKIAEYLIDNVEGCTTPSYLNGKLIAALECPAPDFEQVISFVEAGADISKNNYEPLRISMIEGHKEITGYFLQQGIDPHKALSESYMKALLKNERISPANRRNIAFLKMTYIGDMPAANDGYGQLKFVS